MSDDHLNNLVDMSHELGDPLNDYAILGEGNTSARIDEKSFWVKASGAELATAGAQDFVQVLFEPVLALLEQNHLSDGEIKQGLLAARVDGQTSSIPSIETVLHALCLKQQEIHYVGHTHPTCINMLTCSDGYDRMLSGRLFPDEVVVCGRSPLLVAYADPGLPLARAVQLGLQAHLERHGEAPRTIYMQNHGFIALGKNPRQVLSITAMANKAARIRLGAQACGGMNSLSDEAVQRILRRPDEKFRQKLMGGERA